MQRTPVFVPGLVLLLVASILLAGCSTPETTDTAAQNATPTSAGPLFTAGDIVRSSTGSDSPAWLVVSYDSGSDSYTRALIYKNTNGAYGYRVNSKTETSQRAMMEKLYAVKITHVTVASVPTAAPTTIAPEETTRAGISATVTAKTTVPKRPSVMKIFPDEGYAGTSVSIKNLAGENFVAGATVLLSRNGSTSIRATDVRTVSNKSIICTFVIPSDAAVGAWDVTVTNPGGQSDTLTNFFTVHHDTGLLTTTSGIFSGTVGITYLDPPFATSYGTFDFAVTGSKFQNGARVTLKKSGTPDIVANAVIPISDTQMRFIVTVPKGSTGFWDIVINNPDGTYGKWAGGLEIRG
jgi:hypothetical protein